MMTKLFLNCLVGYTLVFLVHCSSEQGTEPPDNNGDEFVTRPQQAIPWPSLADSPWPMFMHDPQHTGRSPFVGPEEGVQEWRFDAAPSGGSAPAVAEDGTIYFGEHGKRFYAVTPSGTEKWRFEITGKFVDASPLIDSEGTVYLFSNGRDSSYFYALLPDGSLKWRTSFEGIFLEMGSPNISRDGSRIFFTVYPFLYAVDTQTGAIEWQFKPVGGDVLHSPSFSPDGSTLYAGCNIGLVAVDTSGVLRWSFQAGKSGRSPAVDSDGNLYMKAGGDLISLTTRGVERWRFDTAADLGYWYVPCLAQDGTVYVTGVYNGDPRLEPGRGYLYALDNAGNLKWGFSFLDIRPGESEETIALSSPVVGRDGTVYLAVRAFGDNLNFIAVRSDGMLKFALTITDENNFSVEIFAPAVILPEKLYVSHELILGGLIAIR